MSSYKTNALNSRGFFFLVREENMGEIIVSPGKTRGQPYSVCKKRLLSVKVKHVDILFLPMRQCLFFF